MKSYLDLVGKYAKVHKKKTELPSYVLQLLYVWLRQFLVWLTWRFELER